MKTKNLIVIGGILVILYVMIGSDFVGFYFGGKDAILNTGENINRICNNNGACPQEIDGWVEVRQGMLRKDKMLYYFPAPDNDERGDAGPKPQTFRIVYSMNIPDHWFEVQGGIGKQLTSGWESR